MKIRLFQLMFAAALIIWVGGCAIRQREAPEKKAREVMMAFQQSLSLSDDEVLRFFDTDQSRESLLAAINILQNKDSELVHCQAYFDSLTFEFQPALEETNKTFGRDMGVVFVRLPVKLTSRESGGPPDQSAEVSFHIMESDGKYSIHGLAGVDFYNAFTSMKHEIQYAAHNAAEIKHREAIYEQAHLLEEKFDSVIWYAQYNNKVYFYVISGDWNEGALYPASSEPRPAYKMGLADEGGKEIIPMEFEMIGTLGAESENAVEVKGPNGYGYFSLDGDTLVAPEFRQVIPYPQAVAWLVQSADGLFGLVADGKLQEMDLNSSAKDYLKEFTYLPSEITIKSETYALCESPRHDAAGSGHFIAPSYWVVAGLIDPIKFGLTTTVATDMPVGGWTEYLEIGKTFFQSFSDKVGVVVTSFKERYLEGREEFYENSKLLFKDSAQNTVLAEDVGGESIAVQKISDSLIEVAWTTNLMFFEPTGMAGRILNPRSFRYYQTDGYSIVAMPSNRMYAETEFVKLDDTYISGAFRVMNGETGASEEASVYPTATLEFMRDEILASYGMIFQNPETVEQFNYHKWYAPRFQNQSDIEDQLTEIDKHNLAFLNEMIGLRTPPDGDV